MNWLNVIALVFHTLTAAGIIGLVLLQRGRGADAGAGFGAGASGTVFGARGSASFLSRTTAILVTLFFITSLTLTYLGGKPLESRSVVEQFTTPASSEQPSTTTTEPEQPAATSEQSDTTQPQP